MYLFLNDAGFDAFQRVIIEAHRRYPIRVPSSCVLANHWHFVDWPAASAGLRGQANQA